MIRVFSTERMIDDCERNLSWLALHRLPEKVIHYFIFSIVFDGFFRIAQLEKSVQLFWQGLDYPLIRSVFLRFVFAKTCSS